VVSVAKLEQSRSGRHEDDVRERRTVHPGDEPRPAGGADLLPGPGWVNRDDLEVVRAQLPHELGFVASAPPVRVLAAEVDPPRRPGVAGESAEPAPDLDDLRG